MADFTHLHVHTQYSLLDGLNRTEKLIEKVKSNGMSSVAVTDHGVLYGVPEFWMNAKDGGVKPIIGCEVYLSPKEMTLRQEVDGIKYYHLLLIAKNLVGYKNLVKLVSMGHLQGMYYKPRIDYDALKKYSEGLICTSACLAGPLSTHIIKDQNEIAENWLKKLYAIFKEDFYLEIQRNGIRCEDTIDTELVQKLPIDEREEQLQTLKLQVKVNKKIYDFSKKFNIPIVATTDAHYLDTEDKDIQKILFAIKDGKSLDDPSAMKGYIETYIKTPEELLRDFADIPEVLEETMRIDEKIEQYDITFDRVQPKFWNLEKDKTAEQELTEQTFRGALKHYGTKDGIKMLEDETKDFSIEKAKSLLDSELVERIEYELKVIHDKGYDDYFLVVSDIMRWSASEEILTGVRGSVAGSVVAHCIEIVEVDPIKWELYFERFLNPERPSPPDIDMDIQDTRRDELIAYVTDKYGENSIAAICAIGRLKTKAAIRDVARVMEIDLSMADKLSKMVTVLFGKPFKFKQMMETDEEFKRIVEADPKLQELGKVVGKIEGLSRHMSVHACGYLVTPGEIVDYTPLQLERGGGRIITQLEGPWIEEIGLMKFDFLGLRTLSIISRTIESIRKNHDIDINFWQIPDSDKETFELFSRGETIGVFQFESPPMRQYLQDLRPENQEDLCFMVAAYRPGPMKYIPDYIKRKHGEQETKYLVEELKPIVGKTYGFAIYQEQVIKIAVDLAGYTMGAADVLRRAMGKKKLDVMKKEEEVFKAGIRKRGMSDTVGQQLWEYLLPFADYGFNKAHAAGYAVLAYKCAYLKAHYPLEFMSALMHADLETPDRIVVDMKEAKRMGYKVLPPHINRSDVYFEPEGESGIRFGLGAIKNVGIDLCEKIVKERNLKGDFKYLDDFVYRIGTKNINKRSLECLIMSGAFDEFGDRAQLIQVIPQVFEKISKEEKAENIGQEGLFNIGIEDSEKTVDPTPLPNIEPAKDKQKMEWEKEYMGIYVSNHPLEKFKWTALMPGFAPVDSIQHLPNQTRVKIIGMFSGVKIVYTKKDNKKMAIVGIEDYSDKCDAVIFPKTFEKLSEVQLVDEGRPFIIEGTVNIREDKRSVIIDTIEPANSLQIPKSIGIDVSYISDREKLAELKDCFVNDGSLEVIVTYGNGTKKQIKRNANLDDGQAIEILSQYI